MLDIKLVKTVESMTHMVRSTKGEAYKMILKSFEAFMKAVHSKFGLEKLVGVEKREDIPTLSFFS